MDERTPNAENFIMVVAVQCPVPKCRKYQLVEDQDRGKVVPCLICKAGIAVAAPDGTLPGGTKPDPVPRPVLKSKSSTSPTPNVPEAILVQPGLSDELVEDLQLAPDQSAKVPVAKRLPPSNPPDLR